MLRRRIAPLLPLLFLLFALFSASGPAFAQTLAIEDAQGQPVTTLLEGSRAYLRVTDAAADLDPGSIETVIASVASALGQDLEEMILTETGPATGAFTGSIQLISWGNVSGQLYTTRTGFPYTWDTVTAAYGNATASATTTGALLQILDPQGSPLTLLPADGTIRLRVIDYNADSSPENDLTSVRVNSAVEYSGDTEDVILSETGGSTGIFEGFHQLSSAAFSTEQDGVQAVRPGGMVYFSHNDGNYATVTNGQRRVFSDQPVTIQLEDANGQPVTQILQFSDLYIHVTDPASAHMGWNSALATSEIRGDQKTVYLDPSWPDTETFRGHVFVEPKLRSETPDALNLAVIEDPGPPARFDTVHVAASCMAPPCPQASVQVVPSTLRFLDTQGQPVSRILIGSTLVLEGRENRNLSTMQVTLTAQPGGDTENLSLPYAGGYPNDVFFRSTLTTAAGPAVPGDGVLQIEEGGSLTASHPNYLGLSATTVNVPTGSNDLGFVDRQGQATDIVWESSKARIRATAPAANLSPVSLDSLTATVVSKKADGTIRDTENAQLLETGPDTGVFSRDLQLRVGSQGTPWDGILSTDSTNHQDLDRVVVSVGSSEATAQVVAARVHFLDAAGNDVSQYAVGDTIRVRVEAEGHDEHPEWREYFGVLLTSLTTGDQEPVTLTETGNSTGIFEGSIPSWAGEPRSGSLETVAGETIQAFVQGLSTVDVTAQALMVAGPPLPQNDWVEMIEDDTASVSVLDNDVSSDGSPLLMSAIAVQPAHGTAALSGNVIVYTPEPNFFGYDQLHYTVQGTNGRTADAVVDIHVQGVDDAPITQDDDVTMNEDTTVYIGIFDNDTDLDGTGIVIRSVTQPAHGTLWWQPDGTAYYYPQANYNGPDSFTYTAGHSWVNAPTSTATVRITVTPVNDPPVAAQDNVTTAEDTPVTFNVLANDSDIDGDTLVLLSMSTPVGGAVTWNSNGNVTFTPMADYSGVVSFTYGMGDGHGMSASGTVRVTITAVNDPPVAVNDQATTNEDTLVSISVLSNDRDVEFDTLTITAATPGAHGTTQIVNGSNPAVRYTPQLNYNGTDSFTYTVSDGRGGTAVGQVNVTINPQPDPPIAVADAATTLEDTPVTINVLANDSDPDGDTALTTVAITSPAKGTVVHNANHSFTYTPNANANGTDSFTYRVTDSTGRSTTAVVSLTITAVNDLPVAGNDASSTAEDTAKTLDPRLNDSDIDGDVLSITAVTQPAHGGVTFTATTVTYTPAANYNGPDSFTYTVSDGKGGTATATVSMTVTSVNDWPVAVTDTATTAEDTAVTINLTANDTDAEGDTLTVTGVGAPSHGTAGFTASSVTYTPLPNYNGTDSFTYSISDGNGGAATGTVNVTVTAVNDAPSAGSDSAATNEDASITVSVLTNDSDPDGDSLAVTAVTQPAHGSATFTVSGVTYTPAANYNGADSFTYTVSDGKGGTATGTVSVTIMAVNDPPSAGADAATTAEDTAKTISVLTNDSDPDGDSLAVASVTQPAHGSAAYTASGVTYTPAANYNGSDSFTYTVSDGNGGSATGSVTVTVTAVNDPPSAGADVVTTAEDTAKTVSVLANDSDLDGDSLAVTAVTQPAHGSAAYTASGVTYTPAANYNGPDSFTYTISDGNSGTATGAVSVTVTAVNDGPSAGNDSATTIEDTAKAIDVLANDSDLDGDSLSVAAVTQPAHGSATYTASAVTYTPAANYNGPDSFTYTVSDGNGGTATATITVTVSAANDPPSAGADSASTAEDTAKAIDVLANDYDLDGDSLTVTAVTQPARGSAAYTASGVTYTPAANYNGPDSFTYTISDGNGGTATGAVSVTVTAVNDGPAAGNDSATTAEDTAKAIDVLANDSDLDGDSLAVTAVTQPAHGSATYTPSGVTYTPAANYNGTDSFTYTVSDGTITATGTVTVTVTAVNDPPSAGADTVTTVEDTAKTISVLANDSDVEGDSLTVTGVTQPAHGTATFTASGVTYTPAANYNGSDAFTYSVSDGKGGSATSTVSMTVTEVNDPPAAGNDTGATREGVSVTVFPLVNDSDVEGSALTITAVSTPAKGTVTFTSASITYNPAANFNGVDTFTYTVSDGAATNTATVTVTVKDALERVAVLAVNSAYLQTGADVLSGDVIVNQAGPGPFLNGSELSIAGTVTTPAGWDVEADSLTIAAGSTIGSDIFSNQLSNGGTITGQQTATLTLPVFATLPAFLTATPNTTDVNVAANGSRTLAPGTYRDLIVGKKGTVIFSGGTYHFRSITTDTQARLLFSAASTVRVQQKMSVKATSTVGPNTGASINAASILFYVGGVNGTGGGLAETPKAVEIGTDTTLTANLYAPNGTLWIADRTQARGGFIGKDVQIGPDVQVTLQTAWSGQ